MKKKKATSHSNNVYAYNDKFKQVYVSDSNVKSGRNGYFCLGCKAEMEARKGEIMPDYFAHVPTNIQIERKCTYSDETYRHKLAKEILQRIKTIKVPPVYKFPPFGVTGKIQKIRDARFISADEVKIERQFYENESGEIHYRQKIDFEKEKGKNLLIQPDVIFFEDNKPILLIEIVATHKIDAVKLSKLKRLGIDTIQITIPKDSPQAIEDIFYRSNRTKWVFNNEQEETAYIQVSQGNNSGISSIDDFQGKLLKAEESYSCRSSQINNLIRGIRKYLGSEQFIDSERTLRQEIQRVEKNTKEFRIRFRELQDQIQREAKIEFRSKNETFKREEELFEGEEERFNQEEREFQSEYSKMEERYLRKIREIEYSQESYRSEFFNEIRELERNLEESGIDPRSYEERRDSLRRDEEYESKYFNDVKERIGDEQKKESEAITELERRRLELPEKFRELERKVHEKFSREEEELRREFKNEEIRAGQEFEEFRRENVRAIQERNSSGKSRVSGRIQGAVEAGKILQNTIQEQNRIRSYEFLKKLLESGSYKERL